MTTPIERLEELADKATPGPWWVEGEGGIKMDGERDWYEIHANTADGRLFHVGRGNRSSREDAEFIAATANALPALLRIARAAEGLAVCRMAGFPPVTRCGWCPGCSARTLLDESGLFREEESDG